MPHDDVNEVWSTLLARINARDDIADIAKLNGFLKTLTPQLLTDDSLMLSINNDWAQHYIEQNYSKLLAEELSEILDSPYKLLIVLDEGSSQGANEASSASTHDATRSPALNPSAGDAATTKTDKPQKGDLNPQTASKDKPHSPSSAPKKTNQKEAQIDFHNFHNETSQSPQTAQTSQTPQMTREPEAAQEEDIRPNTQTKPLKKEKEEKTFESFVIADTNSMAYGAAVAVAENPGVINNPLFIYGRSGLGKTHLLLAIMDYVTNNNPRMNVYYSPATSMIEDYVNALKSDDWSLFTERYRTADMLLLDDVQYLEGAEQTTDEFFKIFNQMVNSRKHIVLSADRPPKEIKFDERISSRFSNGVVADIQAPKFETKLTIFRNNIDYLKELHGKPNLVIPNDVVNRVVELSNSNIRNLEGAAASLVVYISYGRGDKTEPISVDEAEEIVSKIFFTNMAEKITISDIQQFVESYYGVTHGELLGSQRPRNISHARQVGMYLARTLTQASYPEIGKAFKKDHSSVVHAYKNIENRRQTDKSFFSELERMSDLIIERHE